MYSEFWFTPFENQVTKINVPGLILVISVELWKMYIVLPQGTTDKLFFISADTNKAR